MTPGGKKTLGWVSIGCGGLAVLAALAVGLFFLFVGMEGNRSDREVALPVAGLAHCCSLAFAALAAVGVYFLASANKGQEPPPS